MIAAFPHRPVLLLLCLAVASGLTGCVTDPYTGEKKFNPWKSMQNADDQFGDWLDKANSPSNPREKDPWNPD